MYTEFNYKTKKELKEALKGGVIIRVYQPNDMFGVGDKISQGNHKVCLEGPHYPKAHTWYAEAELLDGVVVKVK